MGKSVRTMEQRTVTRGEFAEKCEEMIDLVAKRRCSLTITREGKPFVRLQPAPRVWLAEIDDGMNQAAGWRVDGVSPSGVTCFGSESSACNSVGSAEKGTNCARSSFVNSRTSPSSLVNGFRFAISACLPIICFAETDDSNAATCWQKAANVQPIAQMPHGNKPILSITHLAKIGRRSKVEVLGFVKAQVALTQIAFALPWVVRHLHAVIIARRRGSAVANQQLCRVPGPGLNWEHLGLNQSVTGRAETASGSLGAKNFPPSRYKNASICLYVNSWRP